MSLRCLIVLALLLPAGCQNTEEEEELGWIDEMEPAIRDTDGSWDRAAIKAMVTEEAPVAAYEGLVADLINESYVARGMSLEEDIEFALVPEPRFLTLQEKYAKTLGDRNIDGFVVFMGEQRGFVMPANLPLHQFIEVFIHETAHMRETHFGEQEPELEEIIGALAIAELEPAVGPAMLERALEMRAEDLEVETINSKAHMLGMHLLAKHNGDVAAAQAELVDPDFDGDAAHAGLKEVCGCDNPSEIEAYRTFAEPFIEALANRTPVTGAVEGAPEGVRAVLRVHLEMVLGQAGVQEGDADARTRAIAAVDAYLEQRDVPDVYHHWLVYRATRFLRIAAAATGVSAEEKARLHDRVLTINAAYPNEDYPDLDDQYVSSFGDAIFAAMDPRVYAKVVQISDLFVERFTMTPAPLSDMFAQIGVVVFWDRAVAEHEETDVCAGKSWYEAAKALACPGGTCNEALHGADFVGSISDAVDAAAAADCP